MHKLQDGNDTIAPGSRTVHAAYDTRVAVAWLPENQTAVFAFRGSISAKNWLTGFQQWCGRLEQVRMEVLQLLHAPLSPDHHVLLRW